MAVPHAKIRTPCFVLKILTVLRTKIRTPIVPYSACSVLEIITVRRAKFLLLDRSTLCTPYSLPSTDPTQY